MEDRCLYSWGMGPGGLFDPMTDVSSDLDQQWLVCMTGVPMHDFADTYYDYSSGMSNTEYKSVEYLDLAFDLHPDIYQNWRMSEVDGLQERRNSETDVSLYHYAGPLTASVSLATIQSAADDLSLISAYTSSDFENRFPSINQIDESEKVTDTLPVSRDLDVPVRPYSVCTNNLSQELVTVTKSSDDVKQQVLEEVDNVLQRRTTLGDPNTIRCLALSPISGMGMRQHKTLHHSSSMCLTGPIYQTCSKVKGSRHNPKTQSFYRIRPSLLSRSIKLFEETAVQYSKAFFSQRSCWKELIIFLSSLKGPPL